MNEGKLVLLTHLINALDRAFGDFEKAYDGSDKENFDNSKKAVLDVQKKINFLLENKS
jgi:hypothetical protein